MNTEQWKVYIIMLISTLFLASIYYWIEQSNWSRTKTDISSLKKEVGLFKQTLSHSPKIDSLAINRLDLKIKSIEQTIYSNDQKLRNDFYWLIKLGIPATFIAMVVFFYGLYKSTYNWAINNAKEEIKKSTMNDSVYVKTYSKILLLNKMGSDSSDVSSLLSNHGFNLIYPRIFDNNITAVLKGFDAVIFDCSNIDFSSNEIDIIFKNESYKGVILKLKGGFVANELKNSDRFSSSTMTSQLYPNLINLLIYQFYKKKEVNV